MPICLLFQRFKIEYETYENNGWRKLIPYLNAGSHKNDDDDDDEKTEKERNKMCVKLTTAHLCIHPKANAHSYNKNAMHSTSNVSAPKGLHESQIYTLMKWRWSFIIIIFLLLIAQFEYLTTDDHKRLTSLKIPLTLSCMRSAQPIWMPE